MDKERYITYLSYYERKEKKQNVGFAKIEFTPEQTIMEIRLKPMSLERKEGKIYFLNEKGMEDNFSDEMSFLSGKHIQMSRQRFDETKGFLIPVGEESFIAGSWRKTEYRIEEVLSAQNVEFPKEIVDNEEKEEEECEELEAVCVNEVRKSCPIEMMAAFLELWKLMGEDGCNGSDLPNPH